MVFGLFKRDPEQTFWKWFVANEDRLFAFEEDPETVCDVLGDAMSQVNSDLTFEFGPVKGGKREFVISAGGIKSAFPVVESLFSKAPKLDRWAWVKFRPRRAVLGNIEFAGKTIASKDVRYLLSRDGDKVGIVLFFEGYAEEDQKAFGQIGYLMLDEALGEYAVETQVGFIEFQATDSKHFSDSSPLSELPAHFDEHCASKNSPTR